jgi:hypothetical protein
MPGGRSLVLSCAGALVVSLGALSATAGPVPPLPVTGATPHRVDLPVRTTAYQVYDADGHKAGKARWRISTAGGNCCETYVSATSSGRIVESGGSYPWYTDDGGKRWFEVRFDLPDEVEEVYNAGSNGEGATVTGPGGDIYGVTWDPYTGDHLQAYRYDGQTRSWKVSEVVMKTPFYDRPWLTYARGPVVLDGEKSPQVLDVTGGGLTKDIDTLSADGLDYGDASFFYYDELVSGTAPFRIPVVRNPDADWWQPHPGARTIPLTAGGVLRLGTEEYLTGDRPCDLARLVPTTATWQCVTSPAEFRGGVVRQDSRGVLTEVYPGAGNRYLVLATSRDGGVHWRETILAPPPGAGEVLETDEHFDVIANGRLKQAVVSARFDDADGHGHDMVFRVSTAKAKPRRLATYLVGKGDLITANNVSGAAANRFDYSSVALLPDGRIATSFDDSTCVSPTVSDPDDRAPRVAILV